MILFPYFLTSICKKYEKGTISQSQLCKNSFNHGQVRSITLPQMLYQNTQSNILWQCFIKKGVSNLHNLNLHKMQ